MAAQLGHTMLRGGLCVWISSKRTVFPALLRFFGIKLERVIFIDVREEKDVLLMVDFERVELWPVPAQMRYKVIYVEAVRFAGKSIA